MRAFLFFAVLPNLVLRALEFAVRGTATIVNLEFLAIALAAPMLGVTLTVAALVVAAVADVTTFIAPMFHFESSAVLPSLGQLATARPVLFGGIALVVLGVFTPAMWYLVRAATLDALRDRRIRVTLVLLIIVLIAADAANGSGNAISTRRAYLPVNVAGAPTMQLALASATALRESRVPPRPVTLVNSATAALFRDLKEAGGAPNATNVALVIVESLGQLRDQRADSALFAALIDSAVATRYTVHRGTVAFDGPTTADEFRELCGQLRTYRNAPSAKLDACLPARLDRLGFETFALHGFRRTLFNRQRWYPLVGLDSIVDDQTMRESGDRPKCGTIFRGPCDAAVAPLFTALLEGARHRPRFVYWLTLSAHFPADARAADGSTFDCGISASLASEKSACLLARIWSRDLQAVRATAISPALQPTRFVIVGDHAPPLPDAIRARLFWDRVVPFVELVPRRSLAASATRSTVSSRP